jgi:hypothetical protein
VSLTRHREEVHIFASVEIVRGMESKAERAGFERVAEQATLDPEGLAAAQRQHDLDVMARGLARPENKRAATAYHLDDTSALRIDFDDVAQSTTAPTPSPAPEEHTPASSRGYDRVQAFLDAERRQREESAQRQQNPAQNVAEPSQPAETQIGRNSDRVQEFLKAEQTDREAMKAALQELTRLFGREVNEQEGKEVTRDRGGGISRD